MAWALPVSLPAGCKPGDTVTVTIEKIGSLANPVADEPC